MNKGSTLIEVRCDEANRWFVRARPSETAAWIEFDDDDLDALLVLARGVVTGEVSE